MEIFIKQMNMINDKKYKFIYPDEFDKKFLTKKDSKKILITIDDAYSSFFVNAWPYLRKNKIPFILFVSTEAIGKAGYMSW